MEKEKMPKMLFSYYIPGEDIKISKKYLASDGWKWYIDVADYGYVISNAPGCESYTKDGYKNNLGYEKNFEEAYQWLLEVCKRNDWTLKEVGSSDEEEIKVLDDEESEEPIEYLKWEDLKFEHVSPEFPKGIVTYNVKMGNTPLKVFCQYGADGIHHYVEIYRSINDKLYYFTSMYDDETDEQYSLEPQLFNDLHLEVVD